MPLPPEGSLFAPTVDQLINPRNHSTKPGESVQNHQRPEQRNLVPIVALLYTIWVTWHTFPDFHSFTENHTETYAKLKLQHCNGGVMPVDRILITFREGARDWKGSMEWICQRDTKTLSHVVHDLAVIGLKEYCKGLTLAQHIELIAFSHQLTDDDLQIHFDVDEVGLADLVLGVCQSVDIMALAKLHPVLNAEELSYLVKQ